MRKDRGEDLVFTGLANERREEEQSWYERLEAEERAKVELEEEEMNDYVEKDVRDRGLAKWDAVVSRIEQALAAVRSECSFCERYRCDECPIGNSENSIQVAGDECVEPYRDTVNRLHEAHAAATKMRSVIVDVSKEET